MHIDLQQARLDLSPTGTMINRGVGLPSDDLVLQMETRNISFRGPFTFLTNGGLRAPIMTMGF
jgi:hypothetical protein